MPGLLLFLDLGSSCTSNKPGASKSVAQTQPFQRVGENHTDFEDQANVELQRDIEAHVDIVIQRGCVASEDRMTQEDLKMCGDHVVQEDIIAQNNRVDSFDMGVQDQENTGTQSNSVGQMDSAYKIFELVKQKTTHFVSRQ